MLQWELLKTPRSLCSLRLKYFIYCPVTSDHPIDIDQIVGYLQAVCTPPKKEHHMVTSLISQFFYSFPLKNLKIFIRTLILCFILFQPALDALSSGIAVPCYYKHFKYLPALLNSLAKQTQMPDEVVISLSQIEHLTKKEMDDLELGPWPFEVKIIRRTGVYMEGSNRTTAARNVSSDIVICIDADDIPHPQRVEAIMQLFEAIPDSGMVLCGHAYCPGECIICERAIPLYYPAEFANLRFFLGPHTWCKLQGPSDFTQWDSGVHNGSPSLRRCLFDDDLIFWTDLKNGADLEFNKMIIKNQDVYLIQLPLLHYFNARSSGADVGR